MLDPVDAIHAVASTHWYVAHCKPLKEHHAALALQNAHNVTVYVPEVSRRMRGQVQPAPFFPGYIFVQANLGAVSRSSINATPGVVRLLEFGGGPPRIPDAIVEAIREQVNGLNARGGLPAHNFHPGDPVTLASGPLKGLEGVFIGPMKPNARVKVLLQFLGGLHQAEVDAHSLERASSNPVPPIERRTRGGGRKINKQAGWFEG